jgi:hypothetical protein
MDVTLPVKIESSISAQAFEATARACMTTVDVEFSDAVRSAGYFNRPDALIAMLNDPSYVLGMGEREMLAELVGGEIRKPRGRPAGGSVGFPVQRAAAVEYLDRTEAGEHAESVASEICARLHINKDRTTLLGWVAEMKDLEEKMNGIPWPGRSIFLSE